MRLCYAVILLQLLACVSTSAVPEPQPDALVRQLYRIVVARHPLGIPADADKAAIWPLLSKRLIREFETAKACQDDWFSQHAGDTRPGNAAHPPVTLKPDFAWLEHGLFSGEEDQAAPSAVAVQRTESQNDGAFRVYVRFTYKEAFETHGRPPNPANTFHWRGVVIVRSQDGRFAVDDVLLFKVHSMEIESRLSHELTLGCDGPRWVGYGNTKSR